MLNACSSTAYNYYDHHSLWSMDHLLHTLDLPVQTQCIIFTNSHVQPTDSVSPHTSSDELGLTGSAIKEEKRAPGKKGTVVNIRGMLNQAIRGASGSLESDGPQVLPADYILHRRMYLQ